VLTRTDLRDALDVQGQRFKAEMNELRAEMNALETKLRAEMGALKAELRADLAEHRADLMKWMFIFWAGTVIPLAGLMVALTRVR